ncbi:MAG: tRNA 2-thiouridine(34) synthase MnmA, partial [Bacteroidia bacterium]
HKTDLSIPYRKRVVDYMFSEYEKGRTPNPDVLCNREIKFDSFVDEALKLGADLVATGHYCRKGEIAGEKGSIYRLLAGTDKNKDQSYFLCQLTQKQLSAAMFPIGHLTKPEVRQIATDQKLASARRKDSQGICFVGKVDLPTFLQQQLTAKTGRTVEISSSWEYPEIEKGMPGNDIPLSSLVAMTTPYSYNPSSGKTIGKHNGAHFFTIGQRKGINIGGHSEPLFVISTDVSANIIYAGEGQEHPGSYRKGLFVRNDEIHWIRDDMAMKPGESADFQTRIRYRQPLERARLFMREQGLYIIFDRPQRGVAPGQFAAWYLDDELIGSGVINQ